MEEQSSWKGHGFTLLVFGGIVFLCSIFFVLGMLVGRNQGQHAAESAAVAAAAKESVAEAREATPDATSATAPYENVVTGRQSSAGAAEARDLDPVKTPDVPDTAPAKAEPKPAPVQKHTTDPAPAPAPLKMIYLQVSAVGTSTAARKTADELQQKGFTALVSGGGPNDLFRVQVGPFSNNADVEIARSKLEALGFHPIRK